EVVLEQECLARIKLSQCGDDLVQLGLHLASGSISSLRRAKRRSNPERIHSMDCFAALAMTIFGRHPTDRPALTSSLRSVAVRAPVSLPPAPRRTRQRS